MGRNTFLMVLTVATEDNHDVQCNNDMQIDIKNMKIKLTLTSSFPLPDRLHVANASFTILNENI